MSKHHLIVENGNEAGRQITIPPTGARLGRSSRNDVVLPDPMLSRHHCRLHFKAGDGLWVSDLGSVNQTLVDGESITEAPLHNGQIIEIGETLLRIVNDEREHTDDTPAVDLGFGSPNGHTGTGAKQALGVKKIAFIVALLFLAIAGMYTVKWWHGRAPTATPVAPELEKDWTLSIDYEKIDATPKNIFRYHLTLTPDHTLTIELDDLVNNKRLSRSEKVGDPALVRELAEFVEQNGFFGLAPEYRGILPEALEQRSLSITVGPQTHHVSVENRIEPPIFETIRSRIEDFGTTELKLWAVPYSADKLTSMAEDKFHLARKLFNERGFKIGNLAESVRAYREAIWFMETVADKPAFFPELAVGLREAETALEERYIEQNFRAVQAMQTEAWNDAQTELQLIISMIPDRTDKRHQDAQRQLIDVENRIRLLK